MAGCGYPQTSKRWHDREAAVLTGEDLVPTCASARTSMLHACQLPNSQVALFQIHKVYFMTFWNWCRKMQIVRDGVTFSKLLKLYFATTQVSCSKLYKVSFQKNLNRSCSRYVRDKMARRKVHVCGTWIGAYAMRECACCPPPILDGKNLSSGTVPSCAVSFSLTPPPHPAPPRDVPPVGLRRPGEPHEPPGGVPHHPSA